MKKLKRSWDKKTAACLCGCGRRFRVYPSWDNKFASKKCFWLFVKKLIADHFYNAHILTASVEKKTA